jgi:hypothetical protein
VRLYHLTTESGLTGILAARVIRCTWPLCLSDEFPYRVVWLSSEADPGRRGWKTGRGAEPIVARITVDVPDADVHPWSQWKVGHDPAPVSGLETSAKWNGGDPDAWYIVERDIPRDEWLEVVDLRLT